MFSPAFVDGRELWLLIFAFYFFDNFCLIDEKQIVVLENPDLKWSFRFSGIPFVVLKRPLYVLQPLTPYTFAFKMPWQISDPNTPYEMIRSRRKIAVWRSRLCIIRVLSSAAFINLFVLGPYLTVSYSLIFALAIVGPLHVALLVYVIVQLLTHRRLLNYNDRTLWVLVAEISLCPGYLPNLCRRISLSYTCEDIDGVVFALRFSPASTAEKLRDALRFRKSEHETEAGADSKVAQYFAELGL
jgi:hypothetical protein